MSTPLILQEIQMRNFLSFGNRMTTIDLNGSWSTLIMGENLDTGSNNGAGKTTIINAICYAFYNKPFDNISLQRLINSTNNTKNTLMEVRLTFQRGDDEYVIYRSRGETYAINISMNGDDITLDSVQENDRLVEEIVGMSYELFTKVVVFSGNSSPFLQTKVSEQRQQIEELFNITLLSEKAVRLKEIIRTTESSIAIQEAVIKEQESHLNLYKNQLQSALNRRDKWEKERAEQIASLKEQLRISESIDFKVEKDLHIFINDLEKKIAPLTSKITSSKKDWVALQNEIKRLTDECTHLQDEECPYCLQKYEGAAEKLSSKEQMLHDKTLRLEELKASIEKLEAEKQQAEAERDEAKALVAYKTLYEAQQAETLSLTAQQRINDLERSENPHVDAYEQLKNQAVKTISYEEIDSLKKELEHQQFLLKLLTDKNSFIRRKIINRTIPFLNNRLIYYTKELGLPHVVKFDDDMSCTVSEYGRELDFGNLSSGEKKRVNLSLSLAFRDVLHHLHSRVNCLFIDEIDGSLDGPGVESVFKMLKTKSRDEQLGLWIISHRPEAIGRFDRTIIVRKENGFSHIVEELEEA